MKCTFLLVLIVSLFGCHESDKDDRDSSKTCSEDPLKNIAWIKELINNTDTNSLEIIQYDYKEQTVFSIDTCLNFADNLVGVYDCERNIICEFGGITGLNTCPDFAIEAIKKL